MIWPIIIILSEVTVLGEILPRKELINTKKWYGYLILWLKSNYIVSYSIEVIKLVTIIPNHDQDSVVSNRRYGDNLNPLKSIKHHTILRGFILFHLIYIDMTVISMCIII